ncbi:MAG: histidine kinase [Bacteroidota bacterium]|nr:histidine kinase [Bacteroidota bacterium]
MKKQITFICVLAFFMSNSFAQGKFIDSLKNWIKEHPKIDSQYIQTLHRISYRLSEKDVKQSFQYYEKVSVLSDSMNFTFGKSLAQINLGLLHYSSGNFDASNVAFFKAIDYAEACGALRLKAVSLNNAGDNFRTLKDIDKCRQYTRQAIDINKQLKAWRGVAINYELLQECDLDQEQYVSAQDNLLKGLPFALLSDDSYILSQYYVGFGKLHAINQHIDSAGFYFKKAMAEAALENDLRNEYQVYLAEATYLKKLPATQKLTMLDSALDIARRTSYFQGISKAAEQMASVYDELGDKDSSLIYFRIYRKAFDSLFSENNRRNIIINESQWLLKKKEIENSHLHELSQLQSRQIVFKNALLLAVLILLILTIVIAFFVNKSFKSRKKRAEVIFKQKIAESQIQSLRAQMNPHFIFNSLNSIENFMMQNEKRKASDYLHKFALLVRKILDSSRNEITTVGLDMEALKLYVELEQMRFNNKFCYEENTEAELMNGYYNVPSLLIQPYVENAIIHGIAHSDKADLKLTVSAVLEGEYIKYTIEDNGIGRCQSEKYNKLNKRQHKSIGLKITEDRILLFNQAQNTNGYIKFTDLYTPNEEPAGTRVEVKIKAS